MLYPLKFYSKDICKDGSGPSLRIYTNTLAETNLHYIIRAEYRHRKNIFCGEIPIPKKMKKPIQIQ